MARYRGPVCRLCRREGEKLFLKVIGQTCSALALLHHFGYSHNDLKPANIKVELRDGEPTTKILDFGLAKLLETRPAPDVADPPPT